MTSLPSMSAGALVGALVSTSAFAVVWEMPMVTTDANFHTKYVREFANDVKAATNGAIEIRIHTTSSLFKHPEIKNAVRDGQVPIGNFYLQQHGNENPLFAVDGIPFLVPTYDDARKLLRVSRPFIRKALEQQNLVDIIQVPWPPQGLYTKKEIKTIDELKGMKFRSSSPALERLSELVGGVSAMIMPPDVPQAFTTGRVEVMITSPTAGVEMKTWDYLKHFYHVQAYIPMMVTVINKKTFDGLDPRHRQAILDAARKAEERGWQLSEADTHQSMAKLREGGLVVHAPPEQELMTGFRKIGAIMTDEWKAKAGADGERLLKAYRGN